MFSESLRQLGRKFSEMFGILRKMSETLEFFKKFLELKGKSSELFGESSVNIRKFENVRKIFGDFRKY